MDRPDVTISLYETYVRWKHLSFTMSKIKERYVRFKLFGCWKNENRKKSQYLRIAKENRYYDILAEYHHGKLTYGDDHGILIDLAKESLFYGHPMNPEWVSLALKKNSERKEDLMGVFVKHYFPHSFKKYFPLEFLADEQNRQWAEDIVDVIIKERLTLSSDDSRKVALDMIFHIVEAIKKPELLYKVLGFYSGRYIEINTIQLRKIAVLLHDVSIMEFCIYANRSNNNDLKSDIDVFIGSSGSEPQGLLNLITTLSS